MTIVSLLDFRVRPDRMDGADAAIAEVLAATRAFPGCVGLQVLRDTDDAAHVVVVETWESLAHDDAYRAWRGTPEGASRFGEILDGRPTLTRLDVTDI
jgi:quinol monooxygenase YgiN